MTPDLLTRLAEAKEGCRIFDAEIHESIGEPGKDDPRVYALQHGDYPPRYTTSLDAAMTLLPQKANWLVERVNNLFWAVVVPPNQQANAIKPEDGTYDTSAEKALCIAALKFRAAESVAA